MLDPIPVEAGAICLLDRAYFDAQRLFPLQLRAAYFVVRAKKNLHFRRIYSRATDRNTGVFCDQWIRFEVTHTRQHDPEGLRRVRFYDADNNRHLPSSPTTSPCCR